MIGVEEVLDHHHRVVPLLERLAVEVLRQQRQRLGVVVDRDRHVLLRGGELLPTCSFNASWKRPIAATLTAVVRCSCIICIQCQAERLSSPAPPAATSTTSTSCTEGARTSRSSPSPRPRSRTSRAGSTRRCSPGALPGGDPDPPGARADRPDPRARGRRGRLRILGRDARARHAHRLARAGRGSRPPAALRPRRCCRRRCPPSCSARCGRAPARPDDAAGGALLPRRGGGWPSSAAMPYGDLARQAVQRFERYEDLRRSRLHDRGARGVRAAPRRGQPRLAGIDYEAILRAAEQEADVIVWDGGNNDTPFVRPNLHLVVVDPHRPGHELRYHPGETNLRMAHVCVVNKVDSAAAEGLDAVLDRSGRTTPTQRSCWPRHPSRSMRRHPRSRASACCASKTAPRSRTARWSTAPW